MRKGILLLSALFLLSYAAGNAWGDVQYTVLDLGTLGGNESHAFGLNASGQVVGIAYSSNDGIWRPFRTAPNQSINPATDNLGTFGGSGLGYATSINDNGQVVGYSQTINGEVHAFMHNGSGALNPVTDDLGGFGGGWSYAEHINNSAQIVGTSKDSNGTYRPFLHSGSGSLSQATDDLGTLGGASGVNDAICISNNGWVVGNASNSSEYDHAFLHSGSGSLNPSTDDLGSFGGLWSYAYGINNLGQVVGTSYLSDGVSTNAFLHSGSGSLSLVTDDLGTFGGSQSLAWAINDNGLVVGRANTTGDTAVHAFVYRGSGSIEDLNNLIDPGLGWTLVDARGINQSGQIVADGVIGGNTHALLLTPTPEPSTVALLGAAAIGLAGYAWRRRKKNAKKPSSQNETEGPAILSFPSYRTESKRRAA